MCERKCYLGLNGLSDSELSINVGHMKCGVELRTTGAVRI